MAGSPTRIPATLARLAVPLEQLVPYGRNPREGDIALIADSLRRHGQYRPIVANRGSLTGRPGEVLAGNHTLAAARFLGWDRIAVTWVDVDAEQAQRIVLVDNRSADVAGYDDSLLAELLQELPDLAGTGYTDTDLDALLAAAEGEPVRRTDPDDAPPADDEGPWHTRVGQVWALGPHRLAVGDCTDGPLLDRLTAGDPPPGAAADRPALRGVLRG